jgi:hypothetical protein
VIGAFQRIADLLAGGKRREAVGATVDDHAHFAVLAPEQHGILVDQRAGQRFGTHLVRIGGSVPGVLQYRQQGRLSVVCAAIAISRVAWVLTGLPDPQDRAALPGNPPRRAILKIGSQKCISILVRLVITLRYRGGRKQSARTSQIEHQPIGQRSGAADHHDLASRRSLGVSTAS